jgi:hypothetical protein
MKTLLVALVALAVVLLAVAAYMGAFRRVDIAEQDKGPFTFVYRDMAAGDMSKVGEITTALNAELESQGFVNRKPLDIFYPDGRGEIGFEIEGVSPDRISALSTDSKLKEVPVQRCMVSEFPWRNRMSFLVGYFKVDPALAKYREQHGYRKAEAMALNNGSVIVYMQPIVRQ